jgi:hypothetical protein
MTARLRIETRVTLGLAAAGAIAGAVAGIAVTVLGKVVTGAPPATAANYGWNMAVFGVLGAVCGPTVTWAALRRVPLWRTVAEPLAAAVGAAAVGVLAGSPALFLLLPLLGAAAAVLRLRHAYGGAPAGEAAARRRLHGPPPGAAG